MSPMLGKMADSLNVNKRYVQGVQKEILAKLNSLLDKRSNVDSIETSIQFVSYKYLKGKRKDRVEVSEKNDNRIEWKTVKPRDSRAERGGLHQKEEILPVFLQNIAMDFCVNYKPKDIHLAYSLQKRRDGKHGTVIVQVYSKRPWLREWRS
ncbi:hypothetical protein J6590_087839 [Homalodisca vitripennis]|nr:hypothetical protein J6590_087839 [Homalodisca vitripennis]